VRKVDAVKNIVWQAYQKVSSFLSSCSYKELAVLGVIVLIPVLAIIFLMASKASLKRKYKRLRDGYGSYERKRRRRRKNRYDDYYLPRKHRVRYVKTSAPKTKKKESVQKVYTPMDQTTLLAAGVLGLSLGMALHQDSQPRARHIHYR
jgi:thymidylate kinase